MTALTWPEPAHDFTCCQPDPWTSPDPQCPGRAAPEHQEAA